MLAGKGNPATAGQGVAQAAQQPAAQSGLVHYLLQKLGLIGPTAPTAPPQGGGF